MLAAVDSSLACLLAVSDPVRPEAKLGMFQHLSLLTIQVLNEMRAMGINVGIISGDNTKTVKAIATQLGLNKVEESLLFLTCLVLCRSVTQTQKIKSGGVTTTRIYSCYGW